MDYKKLFYGAPTPLIVSNDEGRIELMNESARILFGNVGDSLVGTGILKLVELPQTSIALSFADFPKELKSKSDYSIKSGNSSEMYARITTFAIACENKEKFIFSFQPVIRNEQLVHDLKERVKEQLAIF